MSTKEAQAKQALLAALEHRLEDSVGAVDEALDACGSPIERLLLLAFTAHAVSSGRRLGINRGDTKHVDTVVHGKWSGFRVKMQARDVRPYRADFRVQLWEPAGLHCPPDTVPAAMWDTPIGARCMVECDGHDYHERTKKQARNDRSRDRKMMLAGFPTVRFTGSEIHADAAGCVDEVYEILYAIIDRKVKAM